MRTVKDCLKDNQNDKQVNKEKVELVHKDIEVIGVLPSQFQKIKKLYLSNNKIKSLEGIQSLKCLESLSISFNKLASFEELLKIDKKNRLFHLRISYNPLTKNPNYRRYLMLTFPNLKQLDDLSITPQLKEQHNLTFLKTSKILVPFLIILKRDERILEKAIERLNINQTFNKSQRLTQEGYQRVLRSLYNMSDPDVQQPALMVSEILDKFYKALSYLNINS